MTTLRKIGYTSLMLSMILCIGKSVSAAEQITSSKIPETMQPYTEIQFTSNNSYKILKGGISKDVNLQEQLLKQGSFQEADELEAACQANGTANTAIHEDYPSPQKGMKIIYGSDGLLTEILNENGQEYIDNTSETRSSNDGISLQASASKVKIASWGTNNRLYRKTTANGTKKIVGFGRATTFDDIRGQREHRLKKGDVATSLKYDNCKFGIEVKVTAKKKGSSTKVSHNMKKCDAGRMDNAIVDIWKTGVEYWGYTYTSTLSLDGEVKIVHADQY